MEVSKIIEEHNKGSKKLYNILVSQLLNPTIQPELLLNYLRNLRDCVTLLDTEHENMVGAMLRFKWTEFDLPLIQEYQSFIVHLTSVHTDYLRAVLRMIIKNLIPGDQKTKADASTSDLDEEEEMKKKLETKFMHVHRLLKTVNNIVPMTRTLLVPLMSDLFPHPSRSLHQQEWYVRNLLQVSHYMAEQRQAILELVVDHLIKLDVCCSRIEIQARLQGDDMEDEGMFDMEYTESLSEVEKLDVLMELMFTYINNTCYVDNEFNWESTKLLYREMLAIFERIILPTYASCHVQFIMFYFCSMKPALCDGFIDFLWKRVHDPNCQAVFRQTAVCYMSSLLARGKFITLSTVTTCVSLMMTWIHRYLDNTIQDFVMADVSRHGPFYFLCQAVFYVIVFWNKEIFETKKGLKWAQGLNFQRVVTSRLNPLKVCQSVIVKTFSSITRQQQLAFCDTIIERNNRSMLPVYVPGSDNAAHVSNKELDAFFPFDPYLLKTSLKFISPHYRKFGGTLEEEESSDEEDDMFTEDIPVMPTSSALGISVGGASYDKNIDLMSYGTSPGFKHT